MVELSLIKLCLFTFYIRIIKKITTYEFVKKRRYFDKVKKQSEVFSIYTESVPGEPLTTKNQNFQILKISENQQRLAEKGVLGERGGSGKGKEDSIGEIMASFNELELPKVFEKNGDLGQKSAFVNKTHSPKKVLGGLKSLHVAKSSISESEVDKKIEAKKTEIDPEKLFRGGSGVDGGQKEQNVPRKMSEKAKNRDFQDIENCEDSRFCVRYKFKSGLAGSRHGVAASENHSGVAGRFNLGEFRQIKIKQKPRILDPKNGPPGPSSPNSSRIVKKRLENKILLRKMDKKSKNSKKLYKKSMSLQSPKPQLERSQSLKAYQSMNSETQNRRISPQNGPNPENPDIDFVSLEPTTQTSKAKRIHQQDKNIQVLEADRSGEGEIAEDEAREARWFERPRKVNQGIKRASEAGGRGGRRLQGGQAEVEGEGKGCSHRSCCYS